MFGDHERIDHLASAVQHCVVSVGVILGGIWTWRSFDILGERDRARAELEQLQNELAIQPVVLLSLEVEQVPELGALSVRLQLKNTGRKSTRLEFPAGVVRFARVVGFADGKPVFQDVRSEPVYGITSDSGDIVVLPYTILRPGEEKEMPILLHVNDSGLYFVQAAVRAEPEDMKEPGYPARPQDPHVWKAARYVHAESL